MKNISLALLTLAGLLYNPRGLKNNDRASGELRLIPQTPFHHVHKHSKLQMLKSTSPKGISLYSSTLVSELHIWLW
jgi:hypothetical protein